MNLEHFRAILKEFEGTEISKEQILFMALKGLTDGRELSDREAGRYLKFALEVYDESF